ncbi:MAG: arginine--tRNA ligase [Candidatus Omnitrophica bacterium]|nr:arginine--tRNA ligase [Candidatus Omnitrophota bacterium]
MKTKKEVARLLKTSLEQALGKLSDFNLEDIELELPKAKAHGDFSSNLAMKLARKLKRPPLDIANSIREVISEKIDEKSILSSVRIEKPGYINFFLKQGTYHKFLEGILKNRKGLLNHQDIGKGAKVQIEFVSANPTGPLSVAHGRQAAVGESLSRILEAFNFKTTKEYYLNDEGNQINLLGASILARIQELRNEAYRFPEGGYEGEYIRDIAREILKRKKQAKYNIDECADFGLKFIFDTIKKDLDDFGVKFDVWYSQKSLRKSGNIDKVLKLLKDKGYSYEKDAAVWFASTRFGDDKDRVLIKSDASATYITPDIAYHQDKFKRKFSRVINIWGPDHHGYISRLKAAVEALGIDRERLSIIIVQLARIFRGGKPLAMSTRKAQYITLREVMDEVGADVAKFFFLTRRTDSHLDFDLELAKSQSKENPVYYIQYAYARIFGVFKQAKDKKIKELPFSKVDLNLLKEEEEAILLRLIFRFPFSLFTAYKILDPYPVCQYLIELAGEFHKFYDRHKILLEDNLPLANARMALAKAAGIVISNGLACLAIKSPERM